jgi:hypothetical protein
MLLLAITLAAVEAVLGVRLWAQLTGDPMGAPVLAALYEFSTTLVEPFRPAETTTPVRERGLLEFATLVAMEAYLLIAALGALTLLLLRFATRALLRRTAAQPR